MMLKGKHAIVTGGGTGIGLAIARALVAEGAEVTITGRRLEVLQEVAEPGMHPMVMDVTDEDQIIKVMAEAVEARGPIQICVANAGIAEGKKLHKTDTAFWRRIMATNLDGVFLVSQACIPALRETRGALVNIASISGLRASTLRVAYGTSKAGLAHLTLQQAVELGELGIRVNAVAPGPVDTKLALAVHTPDIRAAYHDAIPLNRYGTEDEIAAVVNFLLSEDASYVTGQILAADGGFGATGIGLPSLRR